MNRINKMQYVGGTDLKLIKRIISKLFNEDKNKSFGKKVRTDINYKNVGYKEKIKQIHPGADITTNK